MLQQIVSLTSQNQISIPVKMVREWTKKPTKVMVTKVNDEVRIRPVPDFLSIAGSLHKYAMKGKTADEVLAIEEGAWEKVTARNYKQSVRNGK